MTQTRPAPADPADPADQSDSPGPARPAGPAPVDPPVGRPGARRWLTGATIAALPILTGLWVGAKSFGGTLIPWHPVMTDLGVYRRAGAVLLSGGDIYHLANSLPFLYPPFAALIAVPLALLPGAVVEIGWTVANVLALLAIMHRLGVRGWVLSLLGAAVIYFVEPVNQSIAFGQVGIFLVALVVLDLVPGPRVFGGADRSTDPLARRGRRPRRALPAGVLSGLAAAIKLTPGLFFVYLALSRKGRAALGVVGSFLLVTVITAVVLPAVSLGYWSRLAHGDTGLGHSIIYVTNESVLGSWIRVFGLGRLASLTGLAACGVVAVVGALIGVAWQRRGQTAMAVTLCGLATLLASPVSWSHHFVWVVPLGLLLARRQFPRWFRVIGLLFVGWVVAAPYKVLPSGGDVELTFTWSQNLLDAVTTLLGIVVLVSGWFAARSIPVVADPAATVPTDPGVSEAD